MNLLHFVGIILLMSFLTACDRVEPRVRARTASPAAEEERQFAGGRTNTPLPRVGVASPGQSRRDFGEGAYDVNQSQSIHAVSNGNISHAQADGNGAAALGDSAGVDAFEGVRPYAPAGPVGSEPASSRLGPNETWPGMTTTPGLGGFGPRSLPGGQQNNLQVTIPANSIEIPSPRNAFVR